MSIKEKIEKHQYIVSPIFTGLVVFLLDFFFNILGSVNDDKIPVLIGVSGTLIGFLLTSATILLSLSKQNGTMQRFNKYHHLDIFIRNVIVGVAALMIHIMLWLFTELKSCIVLFFIIGLMQSFLVLRYTIYLCKYSTE